MSKSIQCKIGLHKPKLAAVGKGDDWGYVAYQYVCNGQGCDWTSAFWPQSSSPRQLPWQMRLFRVAVLPDDD